MTNATDRLAALEAAITAEQQELQKGIRRTLITFAVLIVIVLFYTAWAYTQINNYIGPEGLKTYGEQTVNLLAEKPRALIQQYDENKEQWADLVVNQTLKSAPQAERFLKVQIDTYIDQLTSRLRRELFPELVKYMRDSAPELKAEYAAAKKERPDLTQTQFLCDLFIKMLDEQIRKHVVDFDAAAAKANDLSVRLYALKGKDGKPLTRREVAERKILINFILIAKLGSQGSPFLEEFHKFLQDHFGVEARQVHEDRILPEIDLKHEAEDLD